MELSRRSVILGLTGCTCCGSLAHGASSMQATPGGCGVPAPDIPLYEPRVLPPESLDPDSRRFAQAFTAGPNIADARTKAINRLSQTFRITPPFDFYNDAGAPNAKAYRPTSSFPQGKVVFGLGLYERLMQQDASGASVLAVLAHEFGHIAFFLSSDEARVMSGRRTVKRSELHADFLAGYYLGLRKRDTPQVSLRKAGILIWSLGDDQYDDRNHHGTRDERNLAAEAGFVVGFKQNADFSQAFSAATDYIVTTYAEDPL